jgi:hypothetical protein
LRCSFANVREPFGPIRTRSSLCVPRNKSSCRQVTCSIGPRAEYSRFGDATMHTSTLSSIAGSLTALALGVSVATTPALARGGGFGGGGVRSGSGGGGFHGDFGGREFHGGFTDRGFPGGFSRRAYMGVSVDEVSMATSTPTIVVTAMATTATASPIRPSTIYRAASSDRRQATFASRPLALS